MSVRVLSHGSRLAGRVTYEVDGGFRPSADAHERFEAVSALLANIRRNMGDRLLLLALMSTNYAHIRECDGPPCTCSPGNLPTPERPPSTTGYA